MLKNVKSKYIEKRRDMRMYPCGTRHVKGAEEDTSVPICTQKLLLVKQELNHSKACP